MPKPRPVPEREATHELTAATSAASLALLRLSMALAACENSIDLPRRHAGRAGEQPRVRRAGDGHRGPLGDSGG